MSKEFNINDVVSLKVRYGLFNVVGVIHDSRKLFVVGFEGNEFEVPFSDVDTQWCVKPD